MAQTRQRFEQTVRAAAYQQWQHEGCPAGRADDHWHRARDQTLRESAHRLWRREGCPEGRADQNWLDACEFEAL